VAITDLLAHQLFKSYSVETIRKVVVSSDKKRFELIFEDGIELIRAAQGHSMALEAIKYELITDPSLYPNVIHGTYSEVLPLILEQGLKRMARTHIHFAPALPENGVISGMRGSADIVIYIDMAKAMQDGIEFHLSSNQVILTTGIDGCLPPRYFMRITDRKGNAIKQSNSK
jgi:2'-phosphotransferase